MALRYHEITFYPRVQKATSRGPMKWVADRENPIEGLKVGISTDRTSRAEVRGHVEIEVINARFPYSHNGMPLEGVGPGAILNWDGSDWDIAAPPSIRKTRTHSIRHLTVQIRRRPFTEGERD